MSLCQHQLRYSSMRRDFQAFRSLSCLLDISAFSSIFCYSCVTRQLFSVYNYLQHSLQCVKNGRPSAQLRKTSQLLVSRHLRPLLILVLGVSTPKHLSFQSLHLLELLRRVHLLLQGLQYGGSAACLAIVTCERFCVFIELLFVDELDVIFESLEAWEWRRVVHEVAPVGGEHRIWVLILKYQIVVKAKVGTLVVDHVGVDALSFKWITVVLLQELVQEFVVFGHTGQIRVENNLLLVQSFLLIYQRIFLG